MTKDQLFTLKVYEAFEKAKTLHAKAHILLQLCPNIKDKNIQTFLILITQILEDLSKHLKI